MRKWAALLLILLVSFVGCVLLREPTPTDEGGIKEGIPELPEEQYDSITDVLSDPPSYDGRGIALRANVFRVRQVENRSYLWLDDGTGTIPAEYEGDVKVKEGDSGIVRGIAVRDYAPAGAHYLPIMIRALELDINPGRATLLNISDIRGHKTFLPDSPLGIKGEIVDSRGGRGVTFIQLDDGTGRLWALIPAAEVRIGAVRRVTGRLSLDFTSSSLNETLDAVIVTEDGARILALHEKEREEGEGTPIVPLAEGGIRISEVLSSSASLENKSVKIRAVVKNVMPIKSYLFLTLYDGTGELKARHFNETGATSGEDVVVAGNVSTKVELGAGYFYEVLLEVESVERP